MCSSPSFHMQQLGDTLHLQWEALLHHVGVTHKRMVFEAVGLNSQGGPAQPRGV
jgi:hypothetical protein